MYTAH